MATSPGPLKNRYRSAPDGRGRALQRLSPSVLKRLSRPVAIPTESAAPVVPATSAPPTPATTAAAPPTAPAAVPHPRLPDRRRRRGCHPVSDEGTCYEPGEYCRDDDHGTSGVAGDGEAITCEDNDGWRWSRPDQQGRGGQRAGSRTFASRNASKTRGSANTTLRAIPRLVTVSTCSVCRRRAPRRPAVGRQRGLAVRPGRDHPPAAAAHGEYAGDEAAVVDPPAYQSGSGGISRIASSVSSVTRASTSADSNARM